MIVVSPFQLSYRLYYYSMATSSTGNRAVHMIDWQSFAKKYPTGRIVMSFANLSFAVSLFQIVKVDVEREILVQFTTLFSLASPKIKSSFMLNLYSGGGNSLTIQKRDRLMKVT